MMRSDSLCRPRPDKGDRNEQPKRDREVVVAESPEDTLSKEMTHTLSIKTVKFAKQVTYTEFVIGSSPTDQKGFLADPCFLPNEARFIFFPDPEDLESLNEQHNLEDRIPRKRKREEERERQREQTGRVSQKRLCRR